MFGKESSPLLDRLVESLEWSWVGKVNETSIYGWVPLSVTQFLDGLYYCCQAKPDGKFLMAGCGIGSKLVLAKLAGLDVYGIEINQDYIDKSKTLFRYAEVDIPVTHADAMDWDYGGYDFIYTYHPFVAVEDEIELEKHIIATCDDTAVLFLPVARYVDKAGWRQIQRDIWVR